MSNKCGGSTKHQLCLTLSLNGTLTIKFPHDTWASDFCEFMKANLGEKRGNWQPQIRSSEFPCYVRLDLKKAVDRVQFLGTDEYGGSVIFAFKDVNTAQEWLKCSGLWLDAGGDKLKLPSRWSHKKFDRAMKRKDDDKKDGAKEKDVAENSKPSYASDYLPGGGGFFNKVT